MELEKTLMHNRLTTWDTKDNKALRAELKRFGIPVDEHRWTATLAADFWRAHGPHRGDINRSEAIRAIREYAEENGISGEYLHGLFALAYMAGTGLNPAFAVLAAVAVSPVLREPFELLEAARLRFPTFWLPIGDEL